MRSMVDIHHDLARVTEQLKKLDAVSRHLEAAERIVPGVVLRDQISRAASTACSQIVALHKSQRGLQTALKATTQLAFDYARGIVAVARMGHETDRLEGVLLALLGCATLPAGWLCGVERAFVETALAAREASSQDERARTFAAYVAARDALLTDGRRAA